VCELYGIPHSAFLKWDKDDRDKAILYRLRKRSECPRCSTRPEEWDEARGGDLNAYVPDLIRCRGCEQRQAFEASLTDDLGRGLQTILRPNRGG
jgi:hypothetical protein